MARHKAHAVKAGNAARRKKTRAERRARQAKFRHNEGWDGWALLVNIDHPPLTA